MKTNTVKYAVSIPDIHKLLALETKSDIEEKLTTLRGQGVRYQDPIAELEGRTILDYFLVSNRSLSDIKTFYAAGLNYEGGQDSLETLAFKAAFKKRPEVFAWLVGDVVKRNGLIFDPNKLDYSDRATPFYIATSSNLNQTMSDLKTMGADLSVKNRFGQTVLQNYLKFTKQLRRQTLDDLFDYSKKVGFDSNWLINEPDAEGQTPIMTLLFRSNRRSKVDSENCMRALRFFLKNGADPSHQDNRGYTPLMWVAIEGDLEQMDTLLRHGADTAAFNHAGDSALTLSVIRGDHEAVQRLLNAGVDPNHSLAGFQSKNPLLIACQNDSHEIALDLLAYGADPNVSNNHHDKHSPLIYAIKNGNRELVKKLIDRGADPDRENNHGMTPLMYAIYNFRDDPNVQTGIVEDLINAGASLTQKNNKGVTATQLVSELNLELKIGNLMYERNLEYIATHYFDGDAAQAKKHLVNENSDVFELLHAERIEVSDHMVTFMREKAQHLQETKNESDRQYITEGYRLMTRAAFVVTPSVTAVSTTVDNLMKNNGNSIPLAATAGAATMAAYFLSHNTQERKKIRMAIEDAKKSIDDRLLTPLRDEMIRTYIDASLYVNEKLETMIGYWERVCDQFAKLGSFLDKSEEHDKEDKRQQLIDQLGNMLTDDQLIEIIDAIHKANEEGLERVGNDVGAVVESIQGSTTSGQKIVGVRVDGHDRSKVIKKLSSGSDRSNEF